ncbi:MAG: diacylglycerol kinase family protein [Pseudomonadota bacterium]
MTPIRLFVNPKAGRGAALKALPHIRRALSAAGFEIDVVCSGKAGDIEAAIYAQSLRQPDEHTVVAGGDGTFHEAVNGLLRAGGSRLGLVPVGTGNDFAKSVGIAADPGKAAEALAERLVTGRTLGEFDAGTCNGRFFHNGAGIGLDARVARIAAGIRLPIGDLVYAWGILRCLIDGIATPSMTIRVDGDVIREGPATLTNLANGRWVGSRFLIAPDADPRDGMLDLVVADAVNRRRVMTLLPMLLQGRHVRAPEVSTSRAVALTVDCEAPVIAQLDGEVQLPSSRFDIRCLAKALHLL